MSFDSFKVRRPSSGFGWVDREIVTKGHLAQMSQVEVVLYLLLCVVADRNGISCYHPGTLARLIKQPIDCVQDAIERLTRRNFIARQGRFVQVVDLADRDPPLESRPNSPGPVPLEPKEGLEPPQRVAGLILDGLPESRREKLLEEARARFRPLLGDRPPVPSALQALAVSLLKEEASS